MSEAIVELIADKDFPLLRTTKWLLRKRGVLPYLKIGRRIFYRREFIEEFLLSCERREGVPSVKVV
ncbi:MAG: hypothetical protein M3407_05275 [Acidobacteriota bacterium]|jgi:hypothetical protein|nr:hypothetical protein [Acidobacteriota bacterium]